VSGSGFAARTREYTPEDPTDLVLFRALVFAADYDGAARLCRERLLGSRDPRTSLRWTKDLAIVERARGLYDHSLDLHCSVVGIASGVEGSLRGKFENGFGRSLELTGRLEDALDRYEIARVHHLQEGAELRAAEVDTNTGRCYTAAGRPEYSHKYFARALEAARREGDTHLQGEILESLALALEAEGRVLEAEEAAHRSVQLISATGDRTALDESVRTWMRLKEKLTGGASS
jgi:tetratricopeptide (TPR) repeat protein